MSKQKNEKTDDYKKVLNTNLPENEKIPAAAKKELDEIKKKIEKFQKEVEKKYKKTLMGICLLPPQKEEDGKVNKDKINLLILFDDTNNKTQTYDQLKDELDKQTTKIASNIDKKLNIQNLILSELWQNCYDAKYDYLQLIAQSAIVYDKGMLAAVKISEIHKTMVLKKFEKYIVSYVLAGSLVQGKATPESDIDVCIIIDDTDVKKMTRAELKDKLRAIISGMGLEAGEMTGIRNKLNIQPWILTDFWDGIKEANPVFFTFLRDGIPLYDRGTFMPWKQLLKMGKIKPSPEAIDMMMSTGDQMISRIEARIKEIGMEDMFYALLMPSQAAIMIYGMAPPTPKETPQLLKDIFVKKEKILEEKYVKTLEEVINVRKELEHGTKNQFSGTELDRLIKQSREFLERINKLFTQIDQKRESYTVLETYEQIISLIRDILVLEGYEKVSENDIVKIFEEKIIEKGYFDQRYLRVLKDIIKAKKDYDAKKLTRNEVTNVQKESRHFIKELIEYIQRRRGKALEKTKIRVKHGEKYGEVILLEKQAFIIHDIDNVDKDLSKGKINSKGEIENIEKTGPEELEKAIIKLKIPPKVFIKQPLFENLKEIFGKDVEVMINY